MPNIRIIACDNTTPVVGSGGIGTFTLNLTFQNDTFGPDSFTVTCDPADFLTLASPYTCTGLSQDVDVTTAGTVTAETAVVVTVTCGSDSKCRKIWISPDPATQSASIDVDCASWSNGAPGP